MIVDKEARRAMESFTGTVLTVVGILVAVAIFLLLRQFWCWYWKINERNKLLSEISEKLDPLIGSSGTVAAGSQAQSASVQPAREKVFRHHADNEPVGMERIVPKGERKT
jgi:hypothetical protein